MYINNNLARINIPHQEVLNILKNRQKMKNNYLNNYQSYMKDILYIQKFKEKKRKRWIEQELRNKVPWYIKIINILGCIDSQNYINATKKELERTSYLVV